MPNPEGNVEPKEPADVAKLAEGREDHLRQRAIRLRDQAAEVRTNPPTGTLGRSINAEAAAGQLETMAANAEAAADEQAAHPGELPPIREVAAERQEGDDQSPFVARNRKQDS